MNSSCSRPKWPRLRGILRVICFLSCVSIVGATWTIRAAYANAERRVRDIGVQLLERLGPMALDEPVTVAVNGSTLHVAATLTPDQPDRVVAGFERYCHEHSGRMQAELGELPSQFRGQRVPEEMRNPAHWLTARSAPKNGDIAHVGCLVHPGTRQLSELVTQLASFAADGDFSHLGDMLYVVARRVPNGKTRMLAVWSTGKLNVPEMFPAEGDAPGRDSMVAPRVPGSVRLLDASVHGQSHGIRLYESKGSPAEALGFYDRHFARLARPALPIWFENLDDHRMTASPTYARAYALPSGLLLITALADPLGGEGSQISILEFGLPTASADAG